MCYKMLGRGENGLATKGLKWGNLYRRGGLCGSSGGYGYIADASHLAYGAQLVANVGAKTVTNVRSKTVTKRGPQTVTNIQSKTVTKRGPKPSPTLQIGPKPLSTGGPERP